MLGATRIVLDERDYRDLVSGREVNKGSVKIILSDIGFIVMARVMGDAMRDFEERSRKIREDLKLAEGKQIWR